MPTYIDTRWDGQHGIGRYAREVYGRLATPAIKLPVKGPTASGLVSLKRVPRGLIYTPGYGAFIHAERQLLTLHDLIHLRVDWPGRAKYLAYYNAVVRPVVRRTGVVITVSETSKREISAWLNDSSVTIVNAGLGCSESFNESVQRRSEQRPYVLFVGNLRKHKNVEVVLAALARVAGLELRLRIPDDEHGRAMELVRRLGLTHRVTFLPRLPDPDLAVEYRNAVATVIPSTLEGFGLPALESIMTGTPVIFWSGCAAVAETVGHRGWASSSAHDVEEWASLLERAVSSMHRVTPPRSSCYDWANTVRTIDSTLTGLMQ